MPLKAGKNVIIREREGGIAKSIEEALRNPPTTFLELMDEVGELGGTIMRLCREYNILLPEGMEPGWRPEIDSLIKEGYDTSEIGERVGRTRQGVHQYIQRSGQEKYWTERKKEKERKEEERKRKELELRQNLLSLLEQRIEQIASKEGWACQKALEFEKVRRHSQGYNFSEIWKLLCVYQKAKERGGKPSLNDLGKEGGMPPDYVSKLFQRLDIEPFYGKRHPGTRRETKEKKKRVYRGSKTNLSTLDLAYFAGLSVFPVHQIFSEAGISYSKKRLIEQFPTSRERCNLTYRLASQIYEEMDKGELTPAKIAFCLDMPAVMMLYALENRKKGKKIEREIIQALRKMYPEEKITKPYR